MKLKRFFAPDMRQAMSLVRDRIGPDAVIVGNKTTSEGVEIIVAIEEPEEITESKIEEKMDTIGAGGIRRVPIRNETDKLERVEHPLRSRPKGNANNSPRQSNDLPPSPERINVRNIERDPSVVSSPQISSSVVEVQGTSNRVSQDNIVEQREIFDQVKSELQSLRNLIQAQLASNTIADAIRSEPERHELLKNLLEMSFSPMIIRRLFSVISAKSSEQTFPQVKSYLSKWMSSYPGDLLDDGGVVAFVGPTGVGKTTSIAKLAAKFVMRHGKNQLALINLDNYRIGAYENLKIYGRILGVPARTASTVTELQQILKENYGKKLILLDTAGVGQRDGRIDEFSGFFNDESSAIKTCLVLAANITGSVLKETIQRFQPRSLSGVILTKLDETTALGAILSELISQKLPVAYIADGQRVPEDLHRADPSYIVDYAFNLWKQNKQWLEKDTVELMAGGFAQYVEER
ncbi:MAG: flagellar biosynthesis protein FlhF [Gammaproteobacteria bacterium]|nr:flagellar biosynthesis protein FlhF [Gammaproteobacteria bacterium]